MQALTADLAVSAGAHHWEFHYLETKWNEFHRLGASWGESRDTILNWYRNDRRETGLSAGRRRREITVSHYLLAARPAPLPALWKTCQPYLLCIRISLDQKTSDSQGPKISTWDAGSRATNNRVRL